MIPSTEVSRAPRPVPCCRPAAGALVGPSAASAAGKLGFIGRVIDGNAPLAPGRVVTIHGAVMARSETCIEARVDVPSTRHGRAVWLCWHDARLAGNLPGVGEPITARARITGVKTGADGAIPFSDSFVLMRTE
jgi:hypothetical protein